MLEVISAPKELKLECVSCTSINTKEAMIIDQLQITFLITFISQSYHFMGFELFLKPKVLSNYK